MAADVLDMNLDPNQKWFIRIDAVGSNPQTFFSTEVYNTLSDAQARTSKVAENTSTKFNASGANIELTTGATLPIFGGTVAKFNEELDYHLIVVYLEADPSKIFSIGPFTELPTIEDALMVTEQMIQDRAAVEINLGTHTAVRRTLTLADHIPALLEADIVTYESPRRGIVAVKQQITALSIRIRQNEDSSVDFVDELELVEWQDFRRAV